MSTSPHSVSQKVIGTVRLAFATLDSTNTQAAKLLSKIRPAHGTVISAGSQTLGRGQVGRSWHSAPHRNLSASVILYPEIRPQDQFLLNIATALATRDVIRGFLPQSTVSVKWPNDVYVSDRKIAGILIQSTIQGNSITSTIAGIGINVNETDFPPDLPNPTSLLKESGQGQAFQISTILENLISALNDRLDLLERRQTDLLEEYLDCLYLRDVRARFAGADSGENFEGIIAGVDEHGRLKIRMDDGELKLFRFREVEFLRK